MSKGRNQLSRDRLPELGGFVSARRQNPSGVGTERRVLNRILVSKGRNQLGRDRLPELGGFVSARRQDSSTVWAKGCGVNRTLMGKRGDKLPEALPELGGLSALAVRIRVPSGLKSRGVNRTLMGKKRPQARPRPRPIAWHFVPARRQDPSAVGTKRRMIDHILVGKGGDK